MTTRNIFFFMSLLSTTSFAYEPPNLQNDQLVIQVKGVVCSFCAYGTEKNLSKLDFLNKSFFGGDGVLLDINTHRITLALDVNKPINLGAINQAILDGGYDPLTAYVRFHGRLEPQVDGTILTSVVNGQMWRLEGDGIPTNSQEVIIEGRIDANKFQGGSNDQLIPISVTMVEAGR